MVQRTDPNPPMVLRPNEGLLNSNISSNRSRRGNNQNEDHNRRMRTIIESGLGDVPLIDGHNPITFSVVFSNAILTNEERSTLNEVASFLQGNQPFVNPEDVEEFLENTFNNQVHR